MRSKNSSIKGIYVSDKLVLSVLCILCIGFGIAKAARPQFFLKLRQRHFWYDKLDIYAFIYKTKNAECIVRVNGYALLIIGMGLLGHLLIT